MMRSSDVGKGTGNALVERDANERDREVNSAPFAFLDDIVDDNEFHSRGFAWVVNSDDDDINNDGNDPYYDHHERQGEMNQGNSRDQVIAKARAPFKNSSAVNSNETPATITEGNCNGDGVVVCPLHATERQRHVRKPTKLPLGQIIILALILLTESLCGLMLLPFVGFYVAHLQHWSVEQAGYLSGVVVGMFMLGQVISSKFWGHLSDKYGRKKPLVTGLFVGAAMMLVFGLSPNIYVACVARLVQGFFSGTVLIAKTVVSDITDKSNEAKGFALVSLAWGAGGVVGPAIGGFLYDPANNKRLAYMHISKTGFLARYPAFLPGICVTAYSLTAWVITIFLLRETNKTEHSLWELMPRRLRECLNIGLVEERREVAAAAAEAEEEQEQQRRHSGSSAKQLRSFAEFDGEDSPNRSPKNVFDEGGEMRLLKQHSKNDDNVDEDGEDTRAMQKQDKALSISAVEIAIQPDDKDNNNAAPDPRDVHANHPGLYASSSSQQEMPDHTKSGGKVGVAAAAADRNGDAAEVYSHVGAFSDVLMTAATHNASSHTLQVRSMVPVFSAVEEKANTFTYWDALKYKPARLLILIFMLYCTADMTYSEVFPLWAIAKKSVGGLGILSDEVAILVIVCGVPSVIANLMFPFMCRWIPNPMRFWQVSIVVFCAPTIIVPCAAYVKGNGGYWLVMVMGMTRQFGLSWCYGLCYLLIPKVAKKGHVGAMYGINQSAGALTRCVVPFACAPLFAWSISSESHVFPYDHFLLFVLTVVVGMSTFALSFFLHIPHSNLKGFSDSESEDDDDEEGREQQPMGGQSCEADERLGRELRMDSEIAGDVSGVYVKHDDFEVDCCKPNAKTVSME